MHVVPGYSASAAAGQRAAARGSSKRLGGFAIGVHPGSLCTQHLQLARGGMNTVRYHASDSGLE